MNSVFLISEKPIEMEYFKRNFESLFNDVKIGGFESEQISGNYQGVNIYLEIHTDSLKQDLSEDFVDELKLYPFDDYYFIMIEYHTKHNMLNSLLV